MRRVGVFGVAALSLTNSSVIVLNTNLDVYIQYNLCRLHRSPRPTIDSCKSASSYTCTCSILHFHSSSVACACYQACETVNEDKEVFPPWGWWAGGRLITTVTAYGVWDTAIEPGLGNRNTWTRRRHSASTLYVSKSRRLTILCIQALIRHFWPNQSSNQSYPTSSCDRRKDYPVWQQSKDDVPHWDWRTFIQMQLGLTDWLHNGSSQESFPANANRLPA
jgi:hypothetical protein